MSTFLLDTNIIISLINNEDSSLAEKLKSFSPSEFSVSVITYSELVYGYEKLPPDSRRKKELIISLALSPFTILNYDKACALAYGKIKAGLCLKEAYRPKNELDLQIAATAVSQNMILITKNVKDFNQIETLKMQDTV